MLNKLDMNPSLTSKRENLTIRMHPDLKERLQIRAIQEKHHLSDLIEQAALLYLEQQQVA